MPLLNRSPINETPQSRRQSPQTVQAHPDAQIQAIRQKQANRADRPQASRQNVSKLHFAQHCKKWSLENDQNVYFLSPFYELNVIIQN